MGTGASKVAFRDVLAQLKNEDIATNDAAFWSNLWKTETNPHVSGEWQTGCYQLTLSMVCRRSYVRREVFSRYCRSITALLRCLSRTDFAA